MSADPLSGVRAAAKILKAAQGAEANARLKRDEIADRLQSATAARAAAEKKRLDEGVAALLGHPEPDHHASTAPVEEISDTEIAALTAALPVADRRLSEARDVVFRASRDLTAAKSRWAIDQKEPLLARIIEGVDALAPLLAEAQALDEFQIVQAGTRISLAPGEKLPSLWESKIVVSRFVKGLAHRIRPPSLSDQSLAAETAKALQRLNKTLQGAISC